MLDLEVIKDSVGTDNVLDLSSSGGRAASGFKEQPDTRDDPSYQPGIHSHPLQKVSIRAGRRAG